MLNLLLSRIAYVYFYIPHIILILKHFADIIYSTVCCVMHGYIYTVNICLPYLCCIYLKNPV